MINERQHIILEMLGVDDQTTVREFSERLGVSSVTIRQDLNQLEAEGLLKRVHGGAVLKDADDLANRLGINYENKLNIARKLTDYVNNGETILIESGSVNALLARELVNSKKITLITTNVFIARQFRKNQQANIIILGGIYQHESESLVGKITKICLDQIHFDKAFIGIDGFTETTGFTIRDMLRAEISSHIIQKKCETFIVSDSSKFGRTGLTPICRLNEVNHVATDRNIIQNYRLIIEKAGVDLILA